MYSETITINKSDLIEMLSEYWSWYNNKCCERATERFLIKIGFTDEDIDNCR